MESPKVRIFESPTYDILVLHVEHSLMPVGSFCSLHATFFGQSGNGILRSSLGIDGPRPDAASSGASVLVYLATSSVTACLMKSDLVIPAVRAAASSFGISSSRKRKFIILERGMSTIIPSYVQLSVCEKWGHHGDQGGTIYPMDEDMQNLVDEFDRKMRSYITAMLLQDEADVTEILGDIEEMRDHPLFVIMMMSSYGALAAHLMSLMVEEPTYEKVFEVWSHVSQNIEMESILGPEI